MNFNKVNTAIQKIAQLNKLGYTIGTAVKFDDEICLHFTLLENHHQLIDNVSDKDIIDGFSDFDNNLILWGSKNSLNLSIHKGNK